MSIYVLFFSLVIFLAIQPFALAFLTSDIGNMEKTYPFVFISEVASVIDGFT